MKGKQKKGIGINQERCLGPMAVLCDLVPRTTMCAPWLCTSILYLHQLRPTASRSKPSNARHAALSRQSALRSAIQVVFNFSLLSLTAWAMPGTSPLFLVTWRQYGHMWTALHRHVHGVDDGASPLSLAAQRQYGHGVDGAVPALPPSDACQGLVSIFPARVLHLPGS